MEKLPISNAFTAARGTCDSTFSPLYKAYNFMFADCDYFNRGLHDWTWPHRKGGKNTPGDIGNQPDFILSCNLQICFTLQNSSVKNSADKLTFRDSVIILSNSLYIHACNIIN